MNKQELLEELESNKDKCLKEAKKYDVLSWDRQIVDSKALVYMQVINWVEQLSEQSKVTVPKFAADWFEKNKDDLTFAIYEAVAHSIKEAGYKHYSDEFIGWFAHSDNNSIETLIRMKDGYKVEEDK